MANHKATKKDTRQAAKRRDRNRYYGKTTRNAIRDLKEVKEEKNFEVSCITSTVVMRRNVLGGRRTDASESKSNQTNNC